MNSDELKVISDNHKLWLNDIREGVKANLRYADLSYADLRYANLRYADLSYADLSYADFEFYKFPSIKLLASFSLQRLSDSLTLELMRRDAYGHPYPEKFDIWAKGGVCPYTDEDRMWFFTEKKELWKPGIPTMSDRDLIVSICKEKGWKIRNFDLG